MQILVCASFRLFPGKKKLGCYWALQGYRGRNPPPPSLCPLPPPHTHTYKQKIHTKMFIILILNVYLFSLPA